MATTSEVPVLIVGGGAVGSVLSMELARRGIEYRCIDRMPGPGRESRAIALHARTIELMDLVDPALSKSLLDRDLWCRGYVMHFLRDGERTEVRPGSRLHDGRLPLQLHPVSQPERDRRVRARVHQVALRPRHRIQHDVPRA